MKILDKFCKLGYNVEIECSKGTITFFIKDGSYCIAQGGGDTVEEAFKQAFKEVSERESKLLQKADNNFKACKETVEGIKEIVELVTPGEKFNEYTSDPRD